jgi:2-amino-4-hydroxy-6-hydroxymethyldihydropteridine diphosphokinase
MNRAVVALGSNIAPEDHIPRALERLSREFTTLARSKIVETAPVGRPDQPNFLNGAVLIETALDRDALKQRLRMIEAELGRVRDGADKYAPRTIDLDIAVWNDEIVDDDVYRRDFVRNAVREVRPDLAIDPAEGRGSR